MKKRYPTRRYGRRIDRQTHRQSTGDRPLRFEPLEARLCLSAAELVGHWTFDNDDVSGNTVVDTAPLLGSQNGTKTNGGPATGLVGVVGEAASFAGGANNSNSHFVNLGPHTSTYADLFTGTISAWVKPDPSAPTDVLTIFSVSNSNVASEEMRFFVSNGGAFGVGKLAYGVRNGTMDGEIVSASEKDLFDGEWHHVAVTVRDGNELDIYIDGVHEGSDFISFLANLSADASAIGRNKDNTAGGGQWFFDGQMDDVGLWDDALNPAEVKALVKLAEHVQLNYDLGQAEQLFDLSEAGSGMVQVGGRTWEAASQLSGPVGEIVIDATGTLSLNLGNDVGVQSAAVPFIVTSTADFGPGSLRAFLHQANALAGADTITFDASVAGGTLLLGLGQLPIADALTIDATSLADGFTIDAQHDSRVFSISGPGNDFDVTLAGLALTRGETTGDGGAIASLTTGTLTLDRARITDSHATGSLRSGGAIFTLGAVLLTESTVSGNSAFSRGGGIHGDSVTVARSTVSGNSGSSGGGISAVNNVTITQGTISGNSAGSSGGGVRATGEITITQSTITGNSAGLFGGGGIRTDDDPIVISGSIIAGNTVSAGSVGGPDLLPGTGSLAVDYSLIGNTSGTGITDGTGTGNVLNVNALLGPLAHNGGPTQTHALRDGSPAIDAGDPNIVFDPNEFDQRGAPFVRVFDGDGDPIARVDMGAFERQSLAPEFFQVTTAFDELDYTNNDLSLREVIHLSNGSVGADTISFAPSLSGQTILLTMGEMIITEEVTIDAMNLLEPVTIDAQQQSRILHITATTGNFRLAGLTLTGGANPGDGGAVRSRSNLIMEHVTVTDNHTLTFNNGGGIFSDKAVTLIDSTVSGNSAQGGDGGGIRANTISLTRSTISGNSARFGGGMWSNGSSSLTRSTVSGNSAESSGGGIRARFGNVTLTQSTVNGNSAGSSGGGIFASIGSQVTLNQSTVSGNSAAEDGGGIWGGNVTLTQSTLNGNSAGTVAGGIYALNNITLLGSIVANNTAVDANPDLRPRPEFSTLTVNYSLIGDTAGLSSQELAAINAGTGNLLNVDPLLGPLADNGGLTLTHALLAGSPAIDVGAAMSSDSDQRGAPFARVFDDPDALGNGSDIGAYERQTVPALQLIVDTAVDHRDDDFSAGDLSLREAIGLANGSLGADTITFTPALSGQTILLRHGQMKINDEATIDATSLAAPVTIDANLQSRVFRIDGDGGVANDFDVTIAGLILTRGRMTEENSDDISPSGGAIRSFATGNLIIDRTTVTGNHVSGGLLPRGGAIFMLRNVTLTQSIVSGNFAESRGGGIYALGDVNLSQSTVSGNRARFGSGGGINTKFGDVMLTQSTISGNRAGIAGGGISAYRVLLLDSTVSGNTAGLAAGGIYAESKTTLIQSTVSGNSAANIAGGIFARGVEIHASTVSGNSAGGGGGGIWNENDPIHIFGSIVANNTDSDGYPDLKPGADLRSVDSSLIGDTSGTGITSGTGLGNLLNVDPLLAPLADNGGPTQTHALLAGSPAIDAGNPRAEMSAFYTGFDQRGLARIADGGVNGERIDIGAYEAQAPPPVLPGDYNQDSAVNAADYVVWRKMLGTIGTPPFSGADGNGDGEITANDYGVWTANFGDTAPGTASGAAASFSHDPTGSAYGTVARPQSATGVEHPAAITTSFAKPENVAPASAKLTTSSLSRVARPAIAERVVPVAQTPLDLLLTNWYSAKTIDEPPGTPLVHPVDPTEDGDPLALDAAFAILADAFVVDTLRVP